MQVRPLAVLACNLNSSVTTRKERVFPLSRSWTPAHLLINHVTHGHSDFHAYPLHIVKVEVMHQCQANGAERQSSCIAQGLMKSSCVIWVITLKVFNNLPQ